MHNTVKEKIALIVCSTKGLGFCVAALLAKQNYRIILTGRSLSDLKKANEQLENPGKHIIFSGDFLEEKTLLNLFELDLFPDVIIHTLGEKIEGDQQPLIEKVLKASIAINLGVATNINAHYLPLMQEKKFGRIIHISSDASITGLSAPGYAASKAAINAYVKSTARYYAKDNIMICAVLPGIFLHGDSDWDRKRINNPEHYQKKLLDMPLKRFLDVNEIAELIVEIATSTNMAYAGSLVKLTGAC